MVPRRLESRGNTGLRLRGVNVVARGHDQTFALRSRKALTITETLDRLIAAAAIIGDNKMPVDG